MLFHPGPRGQFVVEGMVMSGVFILGAVSLMGLLVYVPAIPDAPTRRAMFLLFFLVSALGVIKNFIKKPFTKLLTSIF